MTIRGNTDLSGNRFFFRRMLLPNGRTEAYYGMQLKQKRKQRTTLRQIEKLSSETIDVDQEELLAARLAIRPDFEHDVVSCIRTSNGEKIDQQNLHRSHERVAELLHEEKLSLVKQLRASTRNVLRSADIWLP